MADELTEEAKAEIAKAISIVRQDKMDTFLRSHPLLNPKPADPPKSDPPKSDPPKSDPPKSDPPKPTDPPPPRPTDPPATDPPKRKGLWWPNDPAT